jgi:hypothetical protein
MNPSRRYGNAGPLRFSAFVPAQEVTRHFSDVEGLIRAWTLFTANRVEKVYLDCLRGGHFPGETILTQAIQFFRARGIAVAAGLTPTRGTGKGSTHGRHWLCYTNADTRRELEQVVRRTARLFDEIIVDDFLCTQCRCDECRDAKGSRSFEAYYRDLMVDVADRHILRPAREENPAVRLVIKYPQWYDRFHVFGYDVRRHTEQFDEVWVGTELRDTRVEYVHPYQAFANYRWLASLSGERIGGGWFDFINCYPEIYVEQAVQTILAGGRELIRFHYGAELFAPESPCTAALVAVIPQLNRLAEALDGREPKGVAFYKPPDSDGSDESYLPDYLGMLGLPVVPCHRFPSDADVICLSAHSASDLAVVESLQRHIERDSMILLTPGCLEAFEDDPRVAAFAGMSTPAATPCDLWTFRFTVEGESASAEAHVRFRVRLHPTTAETLATAIHPSGDVPVLTRRRVGNATVLVLNAKTFDYPAGSGQVTVAEPVSLPHLPTILVNRLRRETTRHLPLDVDVRSRVGVFAYDDIWALTNFNDQAVDVVAVSRRQREGVCVDLVTGSVLGEWVGNRLALSVPRRSFRIWHLE